MPRSEETPARLAVPIALVLVTLGCGAFDEGDGDAGGLEDGDAGGLEDGGSGGVDGAIPAGDAGVPGDAGPASVRTIDVHVPSELAGDLGVAVRITAPAEARWADGAPVVVIVPGSWGADGIGVTDEALEDIGAVSVELHFPGGGRDPLRSGGSYDDRGPACVTALRDVLRYALGAIGDDGGATLGERIAPIGVSHVGVLALSNGGNAALVALGRFSADLEEVAWLVTWESPIGEGLMIGDAGTRTGGTNPAYDATTGAWDLSMVAWSSAIDTSAGRGAPLLGGFFFDDERDGVPGPGDFVPQPLPIVDAASRSRRVVYSLRVLGAGAAPTPLPEHVLDEAEADAFWAWRDGSRELDTIASARPDLSAIFVASEVDHVQVAADHPHVLDAYEALRRGGLGLVRINPDRAYVASIAPDLAELAVDVAANEPLDRTTIGAALEPEAVPDAIVRRAAVAELADRARAGDRRVQLDATLPP